MPGVVGKCPWCERVVRKGRRWEVRLYTGRALGVYCSLQCASDDALGRRGKVTIRRLP